MLDTDELLLVAQLNQSAEQILARMHMKYGHVNGLKSTSRTTSAQIWLLKHWFSQMP